MMVYACAPDQTVTEDYFTAMGRVDQRLDIVPKKEENMGMLRCRWFNSSSGWTCLNWAMKNG